MDSNNRKKDKSSTLPESEYGKKHNNGQVCLPAALSKLFTREGGTGADGAILPYVGHLQLISTLKIGADCCQLCQYKLTKPIQTERNNKLY